MTQTIGFIGVGPINRTLARFAVAAVLDVIVSNSRGPDTLTDIVAELGDHARAATVEEVAEACDIVVVSIPLHLFDKLPDEAFAGKIVVDTMNYYPQRNGRIDELEDRTLTSSEMVQRHFKGARLIKALYNLDFHHLGNGARPAGDPDRCALPIAGHDAGRLRRTASTQCDGARHHFRLARFDYNGGAESSNSYPFVTPEDT
jgi:8-hydroxy-5-deazaflavin:NADPH oxidoreductase